MCGGMPGGDAKHLTHIPQAGEHKRRHWRYLGSERFVKGRGGSSVLSALPRSTQ